MHPSLPQHTRSKTVGICLHFWHPHKSDTVWLWMVTPSSSTWPQNIKNYAKVLTIDKRNLLNWSSSISSTLLKLER